MEKIFHWGSRCYGTSYWKKKTQYKVNFYPWWYTIHSYPHGLILKWRNLFILNAKNSRIICEKKKKKKKKELLNLVTISIKDQKYATLQISTTNNLKKKKTILEVKKIFHIIWCSKGSKWYPIRFFFFSTF